MLPLRTKCKHVIMAHISIRTFLLPLYLEELDREGYGRMKKTQI